MAQYSVSKVRRYGNYMTVNLRPSAEGGRLRFFPGQYATISFQRGNKWSPARCFSMTSSPDDDELQFASRIEGRFTRQLARLDEGAAVKVQGPFGKFVIDPDFDKRIVMLAGGIGITPFMSMLRHAAATHLDNPVTLLYACRNADDIPFYDEIQALCYGNPRLKVFFLVSEGLSDPSRNIFVQRIDDALLTRITGGNFEAHSFFLCGPKGFTDTAEKMLQARGVDEDHLVTESFTQATSLGMGINISIPSLTYVTATLALLAGVGFFTYLDLARYLPKVEAKASAATPATTSTTPTTQSNTGASDTSSSDSSTSGNAYSQTNGNSTNATTPTSTYSQSYQSPMSSVS